MSTKALNTLYTLVMPQLPYCPPALIDQNILELVDLFCRETLAWTCDLDPIDVVSDMQDYDLDGEQPSYAQIEKILTVIRDDVTLEPLKHWNITDREAVTLHLIDDPTADSAGGLEIQVALRPKSNATIIDTRFLDDWQQKIAYGVMSRLMLMPGKTWSNAALATYYDRLFWDGVNLAKDQQLRGGTTARVAVKPPKAYRW